jgi:hypothetical protein
METAKVDIRKLQLLNDRINQTIDALNQVRLSVHGLSHTSGINPNVPNVGTAAFGLGAGAQQGGFQQVPQVGFPQIQQPGFPQVFGGGLSHTPPFYGGVPGGMSPYAGIGLQGGLNPYAGIGGVAAGWNPHLAQMGQIGQFGGLSHSNGPEALEPFARPAWNDPLLAVKVAQTFPYVQFAVPPVVTLY